MSISADNTVPQLKPTFRMQWEEVQDCHVLLYPEGMIKLSTSAAEILKRIDGETPVSGIIAGLQQQYPDADLEQDIRKFLEVAHDNGWIRPTQSK